MRVVLDSNVLIAAFATHGLCSHLFEACLQSQEVVISEEILEEVRFKLQKKLKVPVTAVREIIGYLRNHCIVERPVPVPKEASRDPKDLPILGLAVAVHAECLVSGDEDLLVLKRYHETEILSPRQLYDRLRRQ